MEQFSDLKARVETSIWLASLDQELTQEEGSYFVEGCFDGSVF